MAQDRTASTVNLQWLAVAMLAILQLFNAYNSNSGHTTDPLNDTGALGSRVMRRSLQQIEAPAPETISAEPPLVPAAPSPEPPPQPAPEPVTTPEPAASPSPKPMPTPISSPTPSCDCPAPTLPPELAFLKETFEWDEDRQALIINARTIDAAGHLIVNGFSGIRQSLFIGGDPNNGESATEISPGSILLYKAGEETYPTVAGFHSGEDGYYLSSIEVMGGLQILNAETGDVTMLGQ